MLTEENLIHVPGLCSRWARLGNGAKAHYMTAGESGPSVILLHGGIPGSSGTAGFRFTASFLGANGFRVYCPDMPAFGWADSRPEHWPIRGTLDHVDFIERFADALCLEQFHLSGNSMGCINSSHYVVRYPHRVIRYALVAGFIGDHIPQKGTVADELTAPVHMPETIEDMKKMMKSIISTDAAISEDLLIMRLEAAKRQKEPWLAWWRAVPNGRVPRDVALALSTRNRIDRLETRGIYLYGVDDLICPVSIGHTQEDALPNIQFFYVENCGHQGQTDRPEVFNPVLLEWFRDGKISRATADKAGVSKRRPELTEIVEQ